MVNLKDNGDPKMKLSKFAVIAAVGSLGAAPIMAQERGSVPTSDEAEMGGSSLVLAALAVAAIIAAIVIAAGGDDDESLSA